MLDDPRQDHDCTECGAGPRSTRSRIKHAPSHPLTPAADSPCQVVLGHAGAAKQQLT